MLGASLRLRGASAVLIWCMIGCFLSIASVLFCCFLIVTVTSSPGDITDLPGKTLFFT